MDDIERTDVDKNYSIQDVPWVQFFKGSYGFHAAFWHDDFGRRRSHGCINLSPDGRALPLPVQRARPAARLERDPPDARRPPHDGAGSRERLTRLGFHELFDVVERQLELPRVAPDEDMLR